MHLMKKLFALIIVLALLTGTACAEPEDILATPVDAIIPEAEIVSVTEESIPDDPLALPETPDEPEEAIDLPLPDPEDDEANAPLTLSVSKNTTKAVYVGTVYQIKVPGKQVKSYKSSAKKIAAVSRSGRLTPKKAGKASITITLKNKKKIVLKLKVKKQPSARKVTIKAAGSLTLCVGDKLQLSAVVSPARASQAVTWSSGRKSVATVNAKGLVTAIKGGKAKITARTRNGKKASVTVQVEKEPELSDLRADPQYIDAGRVNTVTFTVRRSSANAKSDVLLRDGDGMLLGAMRDDGMEGDAKAGDGVYTLVVGDINPPTPSVFTYRAESATETSDTLTLMAFLVACPENVPIAKAQVDSTDDQITATVQPYTDAEGYVSAKDIPAILSKLEARLSQLQAEGTVLSYTVSNRSAYIKLPSGIGIIYDPPIKDMMSSDRNIPLTLKNIEADAELALKYGPYEATTLIDTVKPLLEKYGLYQGYEYPPTSDITIATIKNLGNNRLIWWSGHGIWAQSPETNVAHCYLTLSETITWEDYEKDISIPSLNNKCISELMKCDVILVQIDDKKGLGHIRIPGSFFSEYCGDLSNDIIFFSACYSSLDEDLMRTLVEKKNVSGVIGYSDAVYSFYENEIDTNTLTFMTLIDPYTQNYYTLDDALIKAKQISGSSQSVWAKKRGVQWHTGDPDAKPISLCGKDRPARLVHVANQQFTVTDKNGDPIIGAKVLLEGKNKQFTLQIETPRASILPKCRIWDMSNRIANEVPIEDEKGLILQVNTNNIPIPVEDFGRYMFTVSADNFIPVKQAFDVKEGHSFGYELALDGSCVGGVTDKASGKKLSRVKVECVFKKTGEKQTAYTDSNGAYDVPLDTPGTYRLTFSKTGYRDQVEMVTVSQDSPKASLPVQLEPECLEVSGLLGMNIRSAASWIGGKLNYRYDSLEQPYEIYYNKDIEFSGWAGGSTTFVDSILIRNSDRYSLFGVKCGMSRQEAIKKMNKYKVGSSTYFPTSSSALYYVIRSSDGYPDIYVRVGLKGGKVNSVLYEKFGA